MATMNRETSYYRTTAMSYDSMAQEWSTKYGSIAPIKRQLDAFVCQVCSGGAVLDVGCGAGRDVAYLSRNGLLAVGIDSSKGMIDVASSKFPFLEFRQMNMMDLQFQDQSFDGILSVASLHHLDKHDAAKALLEFRRVLKPNCVAFITVLQGPGDQIFADSEGRNRRYFSCYMEAELEGMLESSGFAVTRSDTERGKGSHNSTWINVTARRL